MSLPNYTLEIKANLVAWYGAVVATGGLLISAYNVFRDKARVKIEYNTNQRIIGGGVNSPYDENKTYICITVINKGRRP